MASVLFAATVVAGCSKQAPAPTASSPPLVSLAQYSDQTSQGDHTVDIWLSAQGLVDKDVLQVVEGFALTNNLVSRGVGASKIGGPQTHFFALDKRAIDSAFVKVAFPDRTNAVIEAVYKGTNNVYFDALRADLRATIESRFNGRVTRIGFR